MSRLSCPRPTRPLASITRGDNPPSDRPPAARRSQRIRSPRAPGGPRPLRRSRGAGPVLTLLHASIADSSTFENQPAQKAIKPVEKNKRDKEGIVWANSEKFYVCHFDNENIVQMTERPNENGEQEPYVIDVAILNITFI